MEGVNRLLFFALLTLFPAAVFAQEDEDSRITLLEKRVAKVEKRVGKLEKGGAPAAAPVSAVPAKRAEPANPILATFLKKKQIVKGEKLGVRLYFELENISSRKYYAFNGTLVFRGPAGETLLTREYAYSEPVNPAEKLELTLFISGARAKEYLKLVRTKEITVSFDKQQAYAAN
ncbi:MAG TPA: hypothetical protein DCZ92_04795 [Elusimicrobia bacterium]|nr:MAG: hypothetical protein A2016_03565 [Elusimicrobia bacterium GWF2_62_30]HBA60126.1 hypothetical protein [Elusimicrobiota bacterium]